MAFSFQNAAGGGRAQAHAAQDLQEITTEALGFLAIAGENKLRLLPSAWPPDALPPPTSSLFSIASGKGLLAAASPDKLVIARTDSVRKAFSADTPAENNVKPFQPELTIGLPRLSQVAFSSDERFLLVSAQDGGALAVYEVESLLQGNTQSAFQLGTNNVPVRALAPNPAPEMGYYFAIILTNGQLLLADLNDRTIGPKGSKPILKDGVSCVSWSKLGKQLVAGLGDGTAAQIKPTGSDVAAIPKPPQIQGNEHVSAISWLANDDFLVTYTPTNFDPDAAPESSFFLVHRDKSTSSFSFHKLGDPAPPFGMNRSPPHHFIARLKDFPPNLDDMLIVASTASADVGIYTRSRVPLANDAPAEQITNTFTTTAMADDSRRAQLPMPLDGEMSDTSPIGMALDLSSKDLVSRPLPKDTEYEQSPTPLPALMILNHEGVLACWWIVYDDSIKTGTGYPGLAMGEGQNPSQASAPSAAQTAPLSNDGAWGRSQNAFSTPAVPKPAAPTFGSSGFGVPSGTGAFGGASALGGNKSPWASQGSSSTPQTVGSAAPSGAGTFGGASALGGSQSPWASQASKGTSDASGSAFGKPAFGSAAAFGKPSFGSTTMPGTGSGFGSVSGIGARQSPWTQAASNQRSPTQDNKPANPFGGASAASLFLNLGSGTPTASPFSQQSEPGQSIFSSSAPSSQAPTSSFGRTPEQSFGSTVTIDSSTGGASTVDGKSVFGTPSANNTPAQASSSIFGKSTFGQPQSREETMDTEDSELSATEKPADKPKSGFGVGPKDFSLGSTFKPSTNPKETGEEEEAEPSTADRPPSRSLFGEGFEKALGDTSTTPAKSPVKEEINNEPKIGDIPRAPSPPKPAAAPVKGGFVDTGKPSPFLPATTITGAPQSKESASPPTSLRARPSPLRESQTPNQQELPKPEDLPPLAGSPAVSVEAPSSPFSSLPSSKGENDGAGDGEKQQEDEQQEEEQAEVDDAPLPPDPSTVKKPGWWDQNPNESTSTPQTGPKAPASGFSWTTPAKAPEQAPEVSSAIRPPAPTPPVSSHTPFGFPKNAPLFPPPIQKATESPRSPSPVRSASQPVLGVANARPPSRPSSRPLNRAQLDPPPPEYSITDLSDDEDEHIRALLESPLERTLKLEEFISHQDYVGNVKKHGVPGSIERVYRDINSMLDTFGLNLRSLASFVKGHAELAPDAGRTPEDLDTADEEGWTLVEVEDLSVIEDDLSQTLEQGRLDEPASTIAEMRALSKDTVRLRNRSNHIRRALAPLIDPSKAAVARVAPLDPAQNAQQANLREALTKFQTKLVEAEEKITVLRAKLASASLGSNGKTAIPTVEAVTNTIMKMTTMVESRRTDVDVLEAQLSRLRMTTESPAQKRSSRAFSEGSPFTTPRKEVNDANKGMTFGLDYGDDSSDDGDVAQSIEGPLRGEKSKKMVGKEKASLLAERKNKRKVVSASLRQIVLKKGPKTTTADG